MAASQIRGVVIGVDHYRHFGPQGQLAGCVNDAVDIHRFLVDHVGVPATRLELLLAPAPERGAMAATGPATAAGIRAAFSRLIEADDAAEVFVFYAGHGIRIARAGTREYVYGLAPADARADADGFANLVLGRELNQLVQRLVARGVTPTVIADTCHAGGSLRAASTGRQRRLVPVDGREWSASEDAWRGLGGAAAHPGGRASGWLDEVASNDWVMLAACRDTETAGEYDRETMTAQGPSTVPHGQLTGVLLAELERVPAGAVAGLRWIDLYPGVRRGIAQLSAQTPTLEGRPERPVFGGAWVPFQPGFVVAPAGPSGGLDVAAGQLHGLEPGAEIAIYAPGTADLDAAAPVARARIEQATSAASTAQVTAGGPVAPASRALLTRPGPRAPVTRVVIAPDDAPALGAATVEAIRAATGSVVLVDDGPADVELRRVADRWAMVPFAAAEPTDDDDDDIVVGPTADDVIAYLPDVATGAAAGRAIAAGLAHWAAYLRIRDRSNLDPTLRGLVDVHLRAGAPAAESAPRQQPDATGSYDVREREPIWIEITTHRVPSSCIFVAVVLCSDDGNSMVLWPPPGGDSALGAHGATEYDLPAGQTVYIGRNRYSPAAPTVRPDQQRSRYTFKVFACTVRGRAPDLSSLALERTVQQVIDASLGAKDIEAPRPVAPDLWCTWDLPVRVARR